MQTQVKIALLTSLILSACGGSSSDDSDTPTPTQPEPTANVAPTATFSQLTDIQERTEVSIDASGSNDSDGSISSYDWSVDLGDYTGENISLSGSGATPTLVVGEVAQDVSVTITVTVTDNDGATDEYSDSMQILEVDVDRLPPMPADSDAGLEGTDSDGDGVRDDIEIKVYHLYPLSKDNREVSRKSAQVLSQLLVTGDSADDLDDGEAAEELAKLASCYIDHTSLNGRQEVAKIRSLLIDTPERLEAYEKFLMSRNGTVQRTLEANFDECRLPQN